MTITVLADENIPAAAHYLGTAATVRYVQGRTLKRDQLQGVDALLVRSVTRVNKELLNGSSLRFVGTATSGFDHIDREYLAECGIAFAHAPGSNANSVVEYVLAAIAAAGQKLEQLLAGGTVGIVGYGVIGKSLAARLEALGVRYRVFDPWLDQSEIPHSALLADVLNSDVVSLHAELTSRQPWPSVHLLGDTELESLASGSLLINASRGPVIDNAALLAYLDRKNNVSVVLDVWEGEPDINSALLERVTLGSAHIAGYSLDGKVLATRMLSEALATQLALSPPPVEGPLAELSPVNVPAGLSNAELLRHLLQSRYDIFRDDSLLRGAILQSEPESGSGQAFDLLRKNYRERRELAGATVLGREHSPAQVALIQALDCVYESTGQTG